MRAIFERYLALGSVHRLEADLAGAGVVSKRRTTASGREVGGLPFSRGALFQLLANRVYLGQITHKKAVHTGLHPAIIEQALFDRVQAMIDANRRRRPDSAGGKVAAAKLTGRIFDVDGEPMSPTFSYGRSGRVYRYYVSAPLQQGAKPRRGDAVRRVPAAAMESLVCAKLEAALPTHTDPISILQRLQVFSDRIEFTLARAVSDQLVTNLPEAMSIAAKDAPKTLKIVAPVSFPLRGGRRSVSANAARPDSDETLIAALRRAHSMLRRGKDGHPCVRTAPTSPYDRRVLRLAFLDRKRCCQATALMGAR